MKRRIAVYLKQHHVGLLALALLLGGTAYTATGGPFLLGRLNTADRPTRLVNSGAGPVLSLQATAGQLPLRVTSNRRVPKLNASLLRGMAPNAFAPATGSPNYMGVGTAYTKDEADGRFALQSWPRIVDAAEVTASGETNSTYERLRSFHFVAPRAGRLLVSFAGTCYHVSDPTGTIAVHIGSDQGGTSNPSFGTGVSKPWFVACNGVQSWTLSPGEEIDVFFGWATYKAQGAAEFKPALFGQLTFTWVPSTLLLPIGNDR
jgi:hypothetical protein